MESYTCIHKIVLQLATLKISMNLIFPWNFSHFLTISKMIWIGRWDYLAIYDRKCGWLDGERRAFDQAVGSGDPTLRWIQGEITWQRKDPNWIRQSVPQPKTIEFRQKYLPCLSSFISLAHFLNSGWRSDATGERRCPWGNLLEKVDTFKVSHWDHWSLGSSAETDETLEG